MRRFMISLTILAILAAFGVVRAEDAPAQAEKKAEPKAKKEQEAKQAKPGSVADVDATAPGETDDPSDELAKDTEGIGAVGLEDEPRDDPAEAGRRMVMQGLGLQVGALASDIRAAEDPKVREKMEAELRETVRIAVELRKKYRAGRIARLERLIARLRKEAEQESVDAIVKQLLSAPGPTDSATDPGGDQDDPATDAAVNPSDNATSADAAKDDPAEPESKKAESEGPAKDKDKDKDDKQS